MTYKASLTLSALMVPMFTLFGSVLFALSLQLTALLKISLELGISIVLPTVSVALNLAANLAIQFSIAVGLTLPSFALNFAIAIDFELALILGFLATLEAQIAALLDASLVAYGWFGPGSALGPALTSAVGSGWPDGTSGDAEITAYLFVATTSGGYSADQIDSLSTMPEPDPPPTPPDDPPDNPAPEPGEYPPPQAYTNGLASLVISAPAEGGEQATGTVTVDDSISTGIGAVTAIAIDNHGSGYAAPPTVEVVDRANIVSATSASPIVVTLPNALTVPVGDGFGVTVAGVTGSTEITAATASSPITITVASTVGLVTCAVQPGSYGLEGLNGQWHVRALSTTTAELWADAEYTVPSNGTGTYTGGATLAGNINGPQCAKVATATTIELYSDPDFTLPVAGYGTYAGGTVTGGGAGASALVTMGGGATNALKSLLDGLPWPTSTGLAGGAITFRAMLATMFQLMLDLKDNLTLRANLLGSISLGVDLLPPSVSASLELLGRISANLSANLNVSLPSLSAAMSASLSAQIDAVAGLVARIGFFLGLGVDSAGVRLEIWEYTGPGSGLGAAIAQGPGAVGWNDHTAPSAPVTVAVFGLTNPASSAAFGAFFTGAAA